MPPDRRAGSRQGPYVRKQPRTRRQDGGWRRKRSDAGRSKGSGASFAAAQQGVFAGGILSLLALWMKPATVVIIIAASVAVVITLAYAIAITRSDAPEDVHPS
jgi:hypothetical protein